MAVDDANNLYVADTGGVDVFDVTGTKLGTITVAEQPANCTFGGSDRRMLYITARKGLYSLHTNVPGLP
jgi:gluconolactonase